MLECKREDTSAKLIVTLSEKQTLPSPFYLFVFKSVLTKEVVTKVFSPADDESEYKNRYNQFGINPSTLFDNKPVGEWHYMAFQQESDSNIDPALSGGLLEEGKLMLLSQQFEYDIYNEATAFKPYGG